MSANSGLVNENLHMLANSGMFDNLSSADLQAVARYFSISAVKGGDVIFDEGDVGTFMCIIHDGKVAIYKSNTEDQFLQIATLKAGRAFGEMAVLDGERRSARCVAETDAVLLVLAKSALDQMLEEAPKIAAKVIRVLAVSLSRRLRVADFKLVEHQI